ncbi:hypothetical protein HBI25_157140 [Parastagonospora nodorum]|nr:hypothetical protein HBH52_181210 [Parastagonospora nodorum]KAH4101110.1 hypothetical protein HBH46_143870 [Parastagonospora nodorum]KAH4118172.1 hypothetical protein HBH47_146240 [Parastagonospora nodorum]KAH4203281.1 hypothetical protein HBI95_156890 [Parastagonospora nodorum]KAH4256422.1 hypothetical protein HBI03_164880 [Parastagonospora nodorum]
MPADSGDSVDDIFPIEWRKAIRPVIIRLFRAGVICSSYDGSVAGITIAGTEPSRSPDLYLDYRIGIPPSNIVSHLKDPTSLDRDFIIKRIGLFASSNPDARFSVLRLWSAPHFYPLMLSIDQRATCAFLDDRGRAWEFKFVPKDMPYSEWSIHHQLSLRLEPWKKIFGLQVIVCKDLVLVMGRDKADCRLLSASSLIFTRFALQRLHIFALHDVPRCLCLASLLSLIDWTIWGGNSIVTSILCSIIETTRSQKFVFGRQLESILG